MTKANAGFFYSFSFAAGIMTTGSREIGLVTSLGFVFTENKGHSVEIFFHTIPIPHPKCSLSGILWFDSFVFYAARNKVTHSIFWAHCAELLRTVSGISAVRRLR